MEDTDKEDPKLVEGFNHGYLLGEYAPELAEKLSNIKAVSPFILGLQKGNEQFVKDQLQEKLPAWLKDEPAKTDKSNPSKERDKDID